MTEKILPKGITLNKTEGYLEVIWTDNKTCRYPLANLREACPCVERRGGHQYMGSKFDPDDILKLAPARSYKIDDLQMVGNYAIQPVWDDGHQTGIYSWEYLHKLCPESN